MGTIHKIKPRETVGRETILRFRMQFQAAAYAALKMLSGDENIDRVYCDYHDDFVVRRVIDGRQEYHFFQVKTKEQLHKQWDLLEVFSLPKKGKLETPERLKAVRDSIAGKLFIHTIAFGDACAEVTLLSNVHFNQDVLDTVDELQLGESERKYVLYFLEKFSEIFECESQLVKDDVLSIVQKFKLDPAVGYIGPDLDQFTSAARNAIWTYSEIDLRPHEVDEIAKSLVAMVMNKSCERLHPVSQSDLDSIVSIELNDILGALSISTQVYENLRSGNDPKAIKTASILQRQLKDAGATEEMIELASQLKVKWDVWLRSARHVHTEFDLQSLIDRMDEVCRIWLLGGGEFSDLRPRIQTLLTDPLILIFKTLDADVLFGGVSAAIVRRSAR